MDSQAIPVPEQVISPLRWWIHVALYAMVPLSVAGVSLLDIPILSHSSAASGVGGLLWLGFFNLAILGIVCMSAWLASRAGPKELLMSRWNGRIRPILLGAVYSVALRFALFVAVFVVIACIVATKGMEPAREFVQQATPQPGRLLPIQSMVESPLYLFVCLTFLSFVVAGLREEVWRSGMLVGLTRVLPARLPGRWKKALALVISSAIFGIGHITQGWGAVGLAGAIGLGLGFVILYYESIWESVFAHGFFDATSFAAIYGILKFFPGFVPGL